MSYNGAIGVLEGLLCKKWQVSEKLSSKKTSTYLKIHLNPKIDLRSRSMWPKD
jgi:hypothetical protein